jgi:hypothetical protein
VREPAGIATSLMAAIASAAVLTLVLAATGGTHRPGPDLVAYAALAALTGTLARATAVPLACIVYWLFYAGFLIGRHANVQWHGSIDGWRLAMIAAAGLGAAFVARVWRVVSLVSTPPVGEAARRSQGIEIRIPDSPAELFQPRLPAAPVPHRTWSRRI